MPPSLPPAQAPHCWFHVKDQMLPSLCTAVSLIACQSAALETRGKRAIFFLPFFSEFIKGRHDKFLETSDYNREWNLKMEVFSLA